MARTDLLIDKMIVIDESGMPKAPTVRQLLDKDIKELYTRDKTKDKRKYISECIVIYYMGDPKSPARQSGLSDVEALKMAIEQAGLSKDYIPDQLVRNLITRYYEQNITEAGRTVENIIKGIHNTNLSIRTINNFLNDQLSAGVTLENAETILSLIDSLNKKASEIPKILKGLEEAKESLMYERETELARGGSVVLSSQDADEEFD